MPHRTDPWYMCPAILAAAVVMPGPLLPQQNPAGIREEVIAELSPEVRQNEWEVVAVKDGSQLAWREKRGGKYTAVLNGKPVGGMFDELVGLRFSKNGKRLVFAARTGKEWTFVVDGTPGTFYKDVGAAEISSDGRHFAFAAQKGKQWLMVVDGVEGPLYDTLGRPRYTPDTNRLFYVGRRGKVDLLVEDGKEKQLADSKNGYSLAGFAPKTEEPLFQVFDGDNNHMLIGKTRGPLSHIRLVPVRCSDGCEHSAYSTARIKGSTLSAERAVGQVVIDGKPGPEYEAAPIESAGRAWARALGGSELRLMPGSTSSFTARTHGVSTPVATKDFQHIAYAARRGDKDYAVVVDGTNGPRMEAIPCSPVYGEDGKLYYVGVDQGKAVLMIDGKKAADVPLPTGQWDDKGGCFGPNLAEGGHWVFGIVQKDGTHIVADGTEYKLRVFLEMAGQYGHVAGGCFHFVYAVKPDPAKPESFLLIDGKESKAYADIWPTTIRWTGDSVLTYVARQGQTLLRVTQSIQ